MARILVIEDDPNCRRALSAALRRLHHEVHLAEDGTTGLRLCCSMEPDVVLLDVIMPAPDGIETLGAIRALARPAPVVAMSDGGRHGTSFYLKAMLGLGAVAAVSKPFGLEELAEVLAKALPILPQGPVATIIPLSGEESS